ncbi:unnamed protein product, partial [Symbiodinium sp. KB8]
QPKRLLKLPVPAVRQRQSCLSLLERMASSSPARCPSASMSIRQPDGNTTPV